ncbi:MAG: ISAs1 family transposase [Gammaproteobacteria bacterium]|nr:ISAs1 family transposase [Gammaproteobacteria bacterium]
MSSFSSLSDPRVKNRSDYPLETIIFITICAVVSGANTWKGIESFGKMKIRWIQKYVALPEDRAPCDDVYADIFSRIDNHKFGNCFINWISHISGLIPEELVSIDGKTLRGSYDRHDGKAAIHMVSAWSHKNQIVLGQYKTDAKSNEITAIPALIKLLDLTGSIVTIDAMGCQKDIAEDIIDAGADYILALKQNQKALYEEVENTFKMTAPQISEQKDKDHGRIETRKCSVINDLKWVDEAVKWKGLKSVIKIERAREILSTGKKTTEISYYISSLKESADKINQLIRGHWEIENQLHWVLDVTFREDENRTRKGDADANFNVIRHTALNILKLDNTKTSLKQKRYKAALDDQFREKVLKI